MEYSTNIYADEVKKRLIEVADKNKLKSGSHVYKDLKDNFIDGVKPENSAVKGDNSGEKITYHKYAASLNSSQVMCINFFKKFFENENYEKILIEILKGSGLNISEAEITKAVFEYRPDEEKKENTNLDFFIEMKDGQRISFEVKFTEPGFGGISKVDKGGNKDRYANSWKENYSRLIKLCPYYPSDLSCDKNCFCTENGVLNNSCEKADRCGIYKFFEHYQINRNIVYARKNNDIVVFLTPRENFLLNSGRKYIEEFAAQHNTKNIVNLYWEDVIETAIELAVEYQELNDYMKKFKNKYFSRPSSLPKDILTEKGFINYFEKFARKNISTFYKNPVVNFRGKTEDTNRYFTEVISEWLIANKDLLENITKIKREKGYKTESHTGEIKNPDSGINEEIIAKEMFNQSKDCEMNVIGKFIDYQTPLKNTLKDEAGKIDLLAYDGATVRILELKRPDSEETMLRCVLEGYTYLKTVDAAKLLVDFELPPSSVVKTCPLVAMDSAQHKELQEDRPYLKQLMKILDIKPVYYEEKECGYVFLKD